MMGLLGAASAADPLPSWNDTAQKKAIVAFVPACVAPNSCNTGFSPPASTAPHAARCLDEAPRRGWTVVSMKDDWKTIFPDRQ
jgi:hypothetical protein